MRQAVLNSSIAGISNYPIEHNNSYQEIPNLNMGTLSAALKTTPTATDLFLLSNAHTVNHTGKTLRRIPAKKDQPILLLRQEELTPIAQLTDTRFVGNHLYTFPNSWEQSYYVDVQLSQSSLSIEALEALGFNKLWMPAIEEMESVHDLKLQRGRPYSVHKFGFTTGHTRGQIIDAFATVQLSPKQSCLNIIVIQGWNKKTKRKAVFAQAGDSGALIFNEQNKVIGQLWGINPSDHTIAYASHIRPVLDAVGVNFTN